MKKSYFTAKNLSLIAILSALSLLLYMFIKFPLPFIFPSFLDIQFSDMPILIGGFMLGPVGGCIIAVVRFLIKLPFSSTLYVGELSDLILALCLVIPAALIYKKNKTKKGALIAILVGSVISVIMAVVVNYLIIIPFYVEFFFGGKWEPLVNMLKPIFGNITKDNFYSYYLPLSVIPFNLLRISICGAITYITYKKISVISGRMFR